MTKEEFRDKMREIAVDTDTEGKHRNADDLLCEMLKELGYEEGVAIFEDMHKWYA